MCAFHFDLSSRMMPKFLTLFVRFSSTACWYSVLPPRQVSFSLWRVKGRETAVFRFSSQFPKSGCASREHKLEAGAIPKTQQLGFLQNHDFVFETSKIFSKFLENFLKFFENFPKIYQKFFKFFPYSPVKFFPYSPVTTYNFVRLF